MKLRESIELNIQMTKYLFQVSPGYFWVNAIKEVIGVSAFMFQTLLYQYMIDAVIYATVPSKRVIGYFLLHTVVALVAYCVNWLIQDCYNSKEKIKISQYYKNFICRESVKKGMHRFSSEDYRNKLHNAAYQDGDYLYAFSEKVLSLCSSIILCIFFFGLLSELHPVFLVAAVLKAVKNLVCMDRKNKVQYRIYETNLLFQRLDKYIYNIFYLKQYVRELRMYPIGDYFIGKYQAVRDIYWNATKEKDTTKNVIDTVSRIIDLLIDVFNMSLLVYFLVHRHITVGEFSIVLSRFNGVVDYIQRIFMFVPNVCNDANYIKDIFTVVNAENHVYPEVKHSDNQKKAVFKDVQFSYDGEHTVLNNINIELPLDKKIAIVGENGSGKSTFIKLLLGLYQPTQGEIEYDYNGKEGCTGVQLFSTLLQDYQIFALSVAENMVSGEEDDTEYRSKLEEALQFSGLKEKVDGLPENIHTVLTGEFSEDGISFSGGEQQKLAIARAYASGNPVLVLDEPSSNLDPLAENKLIQKINALAKEKAVILITHNLRYTKNVDLVLVFRDGNIVESGSPEELLQQKGYYFNMLQEQLIAF